LRFAGGYGYAAATLTADGEPKAISYGSGMTETILGLKSQAMAPLGMKQLCSYDNLKNVILRYGNLEGSGGDFPGGAGGDGEE
jgi:hypothetical protein